MSDLKGMEDVKNYKSIREAIIADMEKSDKERDIERIDDILQDYKIEAAEQVQLLEIKIPKKQSNVTKAERELSKAEVSLESTYTEIGDGDFRAYMNRINSAKRLVDNAKRELQDAKQEIKVIKAKINEYKDLVSRLEA